MSRSDPKLVQRGQILVSQMNQKNFIESRLRKWGTFKLGMAIIRFIARTWLQSLRIPLIAW